MSDAQLTSQDKKVEIYYEIPGQEFSQLSKFEEKNIVRCSTAFPLLTAVMRLSGAAYSKNNVLPKKALAFGYTVLQRLDCFQS